MVITVPTLVAFASNARNVNINTGLLFQNRQKKTRYADKIERIYYQVVLLIFG